MAEIARLDFRQEQEQNVYFYNTSLNFCSFNIFYYINRLFWRLFVILHRLILWVLTVVLFIAQ